MKKLRFNEDQALIIQIIEEFGEEDLDNLAMSLHFDHHRLLEIMKSLQRKGFVKLRSTGYGTAASLSRKGYAAARLLWPEAPRVRQAG